MKTVFGKVFFLVVPLFVLFGGNLLDGQEAQRELDIRRITRDSDINYYPAVVDLPSRGRVVLAFERILRGNRQLLYMISDHQEQDLAAWSWTKPEHVLTGMSGVQFKSSPALVSSPNGKAVLFFVAGTRNSYSIYRSSFEDDSWTGPDKLELSGKQNYLQAPDVVRLKDESSDQYVLTYHTEGNKIFLTTSEDGKKWKEPAFVTDGRSPKLSIHSGHQFLTFQRKYSSGHQGFFIEREGKENEWSEPEPIAKESGSHSLFPFYNQEKKTFSVLYLQLTGSDRRSEDLFRTTPEDNASQNNEPSTRLTDWFLKESQPRTILVRRDGKNFKGGRYLFWSRRQMNRDFDIVMARYPSD